jgi:hypothetical protein
MIQAHLARARGGSSMAMRLSPATGVTLALATTVGAAALSGPRPRPFTLHSDRVPLSKALAELTRQTGVHVEDRRGGPEALIAVHCDNASFWQALDAIATAADAGVYLYPRSGRVTLVKPPAHRPPVSYDGFFRCALKKVVASRDLESGTGTCTVFLEVAWEPSLQPLLLETRPQELRLLDEQMRPVPVAADGSAQAPVDGRISLVTELQLPALPRSARRIGLLEGRLSVVAPTRMLTFAFDSPAALARAEAGAPELQHTEDGVTCRITKVLLSPERWTVQVTLDYPPGNKELESYQSWVVNNELALVSPDGKRRLVSTDYVLESATPRRAVLSYHFRDRDGRPRGRPEDWRLTYRAPASVVEWPVHFSFKDVPLP